MILDGCTIARSVSCVRARLLAFPLAALLVSSLGVGAVSAAGSLPDAPVVTAVTGGFASGQLNVAYTLPTYAGSTPIGSVEVSLNGGADWFTCAGLDGVCPLGNLRNGQVYSVILRATNGMGAGPSSAPMTGVPSTPVGSDPDRPAVLPKPNARVGGVFEAAGNALGVKGATTRLGVGTLPKLRFSRAITNKAAVERNLAVTATADATGISKAVEGAWGWLDDRTVVFRPKKFWPGNSTITITSTLDRAVLGKSGSTWLVGGRTLDGPFVFRTARALVAKVDGKTHRMRVFVDGTKVKDFPISLGKAEWETRNGVKVISTDKQAEKIYTSQALDITDPDEQYELPAKWNTRLTPTGEFLHTATWAYGRLGRWNGSHGCTNMFEKDAKWIFDKTIPGDVVSYTNTGGNMMEPNNGPGGLWNIPWDLWLKKSALSSLTGDVDTVTGTGSTDNLPEASA